MTKNTKIALISAAVVLALAAILLIFLIFGSSSSAEEEIPTETPVVTETPEPTATPVPEETISATIAIGGDLLMHSGLNTEVYDGTTYDYSTIFGIITDYIESADYAVASLATSFSATGDYTSYPLFKSPDSLATSLASVGFDLINTATSHAADSYKDGIDYTLNVLEYAGLEHVGTYRTEEEREENSGATLVDINGITVAFVSYTCSTNKIPVTGFEYSLNVATTDYLDDASSIDYDLIETDMAAVRDLGADFIFVFMSWGNEFDILPNDTQRELADFLVDEGADVIIGGHTRVPQPVETQTVIDEDGNEKTAYIIYSLGNLLSCQNDAYTNISAIFNIELTKGVDSGDVTISNVCYEPIYMVDLYDYDIDDYGWHYRLASINAAVEAYNSEYPWAFMTEDIYNDMLQALTDLEGFFGTDIENTIILEAD